MHLKSKSAMIRYNLLQKGCFNIRIKYIYTNEKKKTAGKKGRLLMLDPRSEKVVKTFKEK